MNETVNILDAIKRLNPEQRKAVEAVDGPLLIMAGAGSGKTRVLTHRIAYLIGTRRAAPWSILALTFTNKAAREMQDRVGKLVGGSGSDIWVSTFHSMCVRMLRRDISRIGFTSNFTILDSGDQLSVIKTCCKELNIDTKKFEPKTFQAAISTAKNELISPKQFEDKIGDYFDGLTSKIYTLYQKKLRSNNSLDFDDLIMATIHLFNEVPEVLEFYQNKFQYIHVDEYQDTNRAQYMLCQMIAAKHKRICVVGDSDQSIYRWRGADISNILNFEKDYPNATAILLEQNYRSTSNILQAANKVIANNTGRKPKNLWTDKEGGVRIKLYQADSEHEEGYFVTSEINKNKSNGKKFGHHAILYRTNAQSRVIEEILIKSDIQYTIVGGVKFYDRKEIKDILAYLRLISNPDDDISLSRIVNVPKRGIGDTSMDRVADMAGEEEVFHYMPCWRKSIHWRSRTKAKHALADFREMIDNLNRMVEYLSVTELTEKILEMSQYRLEMQRENTIESKARLENIEEFLSVTMDFEKRNEDKSLISFLTDLALIADIDTLDKDKTEEEQDAVVLMTMHSAKGLEFPVVFIIGMEEGVFPHSRASPITKSSKRSAVWPMSASRAPSKSCSSRAPACARSSAAPPRTRHRDSSRRFRRNSWRASRLAAPAAGSRELAVTSSSWGSSAASHGPRLRRLVRLGHAVLLRGRPSTTAGAAAPSPAAGAKTGCIPGSAAYRRRRGAGLQSQRQSVAWQVGHRHRRVRERLG